MTRLGILAVVWSWVMVMALPRQLAVHGLRRSYPVLHPTGVPPVTTAGK
jgi:hypothetical protein